MSCLLEMGDDVVEILNSSFHSKQNAFSDVVEDSSMLEVVMVAVVHEPSEIADIDFLPFVVRRRNHLMEFVGSQKQGSWDQYLKLLLGLWWFDNSRNQRFWCNNWFRCSNCFRCNN